MFILAVDSATQVAGVALAARDKVVREEFVNFRRNHSEILMPQIDRVMKESQCNWQQITALAVTAGPGSFTGLRIGMATVKGLSLATNLPVAAISTLDVLAHNIAGSPALVAALLDARREEVYFCCYDVEGRFPLALMPMMACTPQTAVDEIMTLLEKTGRQKVILLGDGVAPYQQLFSDRLAPYTVPVSPHQMMPRAAALASLAWEAWDHNRLVDGLSVKPAYIRLSEAEYRLERGVSG